MAANKCEHCGARFDVKGAVGTLDQHIANFHPGEATKTQLAKAAAHDDAAGRTEAGSAGNGGANEGAPSPEMQSTDKPLDKLTKPQLIELAEAENVEVKKGDTNASMIAAIEAARAKKS